MSTREAAYIIFENLSQEELEEFIELFGKKKSAKRKSARGVFNFAADPKLVSLEEGAWEREISERYR